MQKTMKNDKQLDLLPGCLIRIKEKYNNLRPSEQTVADFILTDPQDVIHKSIGELAMESKVSEATIIRFCKSIGYNGYQNMKMSLAQDIVVPTQFMSKEISKNDDLSTIIQKVHNSNITAINNTTNIINEESLKKAVIAINQAKKVDFYGVGLSGVVANDASIRFLRIGVPAYSYLDPHLQAHSAALLQEKDVVIAISLLGKTEDVYYSILQAKKSGATIISLSKYSNNPISEISDINLFSTTEDELFRTGASRIAQLHVLDILFAAVAVNRYDDSVKYLEKTKHIGADKRI